MNRQRVRSIVFWSTVAVAMLLMLLPLPSAVEALKPYWLALVLVYWALESSDMVGLGLAFGVGLAADVIHGIMLGEQAMRLTIMIFIVLRFRARLRFFPMWQQALAVLALLLNDRVIELALHSIAGHPIPPISYWLAPFVGALVWPFLFLLLDDIRARLRAYET